MAPSKTLQIYNTYIAPATNALMDLGSLTLQFKDLYIDGIAYIDQLNLEGNLDMDDNDITSIGILYGLDSGIFIDIGNDGRMLISADGGGSPFSTPDIDITGSVFFDDDIGLDSTKKTMYRNANTNIQSGDVDHLDLNADVSVDVNAKLVIGTNTLEANSIEVIGSDGLINGATMVNMVFNDDEAISNNNNAVFI